MTQKPRFRPVLPSALAAAAAMLVCSPADAQPSSAQLDLGRKVYVAKGCYQCHGLVGQGSIASGPALVPSRLQLAGFRAYVRKPAGNMPPYSVTLLPDAEVEAVLTYLQAMPRSRSASDIPLLAPYLKATPAKASAPAHKSPAPASRNAAGPAQTAKAAVPAAGNAARGAEIYKTSCAACHGPALQSGVAPALTDEARKRTFDQTAAFIRNPPERMPKLYPSPLDDTDVRDVTAFIRRPR